MTCKEYLSQLRTLKKIITCHQERCRALRFEADAVACRWGEHIGSRSADAPYVRLMEKIEALEEKLKDENSLYDALYAQITDLVERLPDVDLRLVLLYRYVDGKSFSEIGSLMLMSKATAVRMEQNALSQLVLPENPVCIAA